MSRVGRILVGMILAAGCAPLCAQVPASSAASGESAEDIRDIRGPKSLLADTPLLPAIAAVVILGLAGYGAWRWQRRKVQARVLLPHEIALQELERARAAMQPGAGREFGGAVSDIVRSYIERQFRLEATQRTTQEFLQQLLDAADTPLARQRPLLSDFLQQCDVVKFAGGALSAQGFDSLFESARRFVRETAQSETQHVSLPAA
jgi:hypothetical protein